MVRIFLTALFLGSFLLAFAQNTSSQKLPPELAGTLAFGSRSESVRLLQEYLAQDKAVYPEGLVTGYFGKLTVAAVERWQTKHGIESVGIVGPKTRAKLKKLRGEALAEAVLPVVTPQLIATPTPSLATVTPAVATVSPASLIKTGSGVVENDRFFDVGTGKLYYSGGSGVDSRGFISGGNPKAFIGDLSDGRDFSTCEDTKAYSYRGISNICQFTDSKQVVFTLLPAEGVRFYDKTAVKGAQAFPCNNGIMLFKQNDRYGGVDFEKIDKEARLQYRYWYDESGGTNFGSLCPSKATVSKLASLLDTLTAALRKLKELLR